MAQRHNEQRDWRTICGIRTDLKGRKVHQGENPIPIEGIESIMGFEELQEQLSSVRASFPRIVSFIRHRGFLVFLEIFSDAAEGFAVHAHLGLIAASLLDATHRVIKDHLVSAHIEHYIHVPALLKFLEIEHPLQPEVVGQEVHIVSVHCCPNLALARCGVVY